MAKLTLADPLDCSEMQKRWVEQARKVVSLYSNRSANVKDDLDHYETYIEKYGQGVLESHELEHNAVASEESGVDAYRAADTIAWNMLDEMEDWLAQIWVASRNRGAEAEKAAECIKFCYDTIVGFSIEYGRESEDVELRDPSGKLLSSGFSHGVVIFSTLREVLVNAYLAGDECTTPRIESILRQGWEDYNDELAVVFDEEDDDDGEDEEDEDEEDEEEKVEKEEKLTETVRTARERVRECFHSTAQDRAWARFASSSIAEYDWNRLLDESPDSKDRALASVRRKYLDEKPTSSTRWSDGFYILSKFGDINDVARLLRIMPSEDEYDLERTKIRAVQFLVPTESHRERILPLLLDGLRSTTRDFMDDLLSCFPEIDKACRSLVAEIGRGAIKPYEQGAKNLTPRRSNELDRFVKTALGEASEVPKGTISRGLSIADKLKGWTNILNELAGRMPSREVSGMRDLTIRAIETHPLFKDCGDFAEVLMLRCKDRRRETEQAIREAYDLFAPKRPKASGQQSAPQGKKRGQPQVEHSNKRARQ